MTECQQLRSLLMALLASDGHLTRCAFSGCNCGKVENYKIARGDATRWLHDHPLIAMRQDGLPHTDFNDKYLGDWPQQPSEPDV